MGERNDISIEAFGIGQGTGLTEEEHSSSIGLFQKYLRIIYFKKQRSLRHSYRQELRIGKSDGSLIQSLHRPSE